MPKELFNSCTSQIKLQIYLIGGMSIPPWYSYFSEERKGQEFVIECMKRRFLSRKFANTFSVAIFYDNVTKREIERFYPGDVKR